MPPLRPVAEVRAGALDRLGLAPDAVPALRVLPVAVAGAEVRLRYELGELGQVTEQFTFQRDVGAALTGPRGAALRRALGILATTALVSYHKAVLPPVVELPGAPRALRELAAALVTDGLAEHGYRNGADLRGWTAVDAGAGDLVPELDWDGQTGLVELGSRPLIPVGGGKDSIVTLTALEHRDPVLFAVNPRPAMRRTAAVAGRDLLAVDRSLDDRLLDWNDRGALNGHVPVTAIVSAAAVVAALLEDCRAVVLSNERSADEPTVVVDGWAVNHQWSKSWEFERRFRRLVTDHVHRDLTYLSLLRPAAELVIARAFSRHPRFHAAFNSCNRAFRLRGERTEWCGDCPKCRFVFLMLAVFLPREDVIAIVGRDLLDAADQLDGYRELLALPGHDKPFECVGEAAESRAAMDALAARDAWARATVVAALGTPDPRALETWVQPGDVERLPPAFRDDYLAALAPDAAPHP